MSCSIHPNIKKYMSMVETGEIRACIEQHDLIKYVRHVFETEDIFINVDQYEKYLSQAKYFPYEEVMPWEQFVLGLHLCTYRTSDGMPRWSDLFLLIGRGAGKDGYIAFSSECLISPYNGIKKYDVDICANSEEQAKAPFDDLWEILEDPDMGSLLKKHFYHTKEEIIGIKMKSRMKYRTNNPKGKDGLRSGIVIFNEIHQYEDYKNINVFTTGLGKKAHPRRLYATTNGDVRDGPLDDLLETSHQILRGDIPDNGLLPFICKLNKKDEIYDPLNWEMANPSLRYFPNLMEEIEKEFKTWQRDPSKFTAFPTKRMNIPDGDTEIQVTAWENILATNKPMPNIKYKTAVVGIDYSKITDFASVNIHVKDGNVRYDISHSWLCSKSADIPKLKIPWQQWVQDGRLTYVEDVEINPDLIVDYIREQARNYNIIKIALDDFRYALLAKALNNLGFSYENKNIKLIRLSDIMKVVPVVDSAFVSQSFIWGDDPVLRWATNNTKLIKMGKRQGQDLGNYVYGKIESKTRKTDPFMALVHSMCIEAELPDMQAKVMDLDVSTF